MAQSDALDMESLQPQVRPPYVAFERKAVEDRALTLSRGIMTMKDVDMVYVTPIGTRDRLEKTVEGWLEGLKMQVANGRIPQTWIVQYTQAYEAWKNGQEVPLQGTPIRGWSLLSPAQQDNIIRANVRTVEDLAQANEESLGRIGMGAVTLKETAAQWIKAQTGPGKLVQENVALKAKVAGLEVRLETLTKQISTMLEKQAKETA
jgi:hypothetical protein